MNIVDPKLEAGLNRIRLRFLSVLDERLDQIEMQYDALEQPALRATALALIKSEAHKIAGTARTVGYSDLGVLALKVDQGIPADTTIGFSAETITALMDDIDMLIEEGAAIIRAHQHDMATG